MEADYVLEKHIGKVSSGTGGATGNEVHGFQKAVDKDSDSIILSSVLGKLTIRSIAM